MAPSHSAQEPWFFEENENVGTENGTNGNASFHSETSTIAADESDHLACVEDTIANLKLIETLLEKFEEKSALLDKAKKSAWLDKVTKWEKLLRALTNSPTIDGAGAEHDNGEGSSNSVANGSPSIGNGAIGLITNKTIVKPYEPAYMPLAIRRLRPLMSLSLPQGHQVLPFSANHHTFTLKFLTRIFGGREFSPGLHYPATGTPTSALKYKELLPKSKTFYAMDAAVEPFLPGNPGGHGAKLSVLYNNVGGDGAYVSVPLFVCLSGKEEDGVANGSEKGNAVADGKGKGKDLNAAAVKVVEKQYTYMGHYTQFRWSDKLDYDRVVEVVPTSVKEFWSKKLAAHPDRPMWMEEALMEHFMPKPQYEGKLSEDSDDEITTATSVPAKDDADEEDMYSDMAAYLERLEDWKEDARIMSKTLKKEDIMAAFDRADDAEEPALRFWWEYLECVKFDRNFYYMLVAARNSGT